MTSKNSSTHCVGKTAASLIPKHEKKTSVLIVFSCHLYLWIVAHDNTKENWMAADFFFNICLLPILIFSWGMPTSYPTLWPLKQGRENSMWANKMEPA